jgi:hypothetical protein
LGLKRETNIKFFCICISAALFAKDPTYTYILEEVYLGSKNFKTSRVVVHGRDTKEG